jgi:hypothetical protein
MRRCDQIQERAIFIREDFGEALRRGEPHFRIGSGRP